MQTIKINNRKELDALELKHPGVVRMAETLRSLERYPLTLVLGDDAITAKFDIPGPIRYVSGSYEVETVGLVNAPPDTNCKVFDMLAAHYQVPARMLRGEPLIENKTQHFNFELKADTNYLALAYAARFTAALEKVRKVKNHGPRGKWGKLK